MSMFTQGATLIAHCYLNPDKREEFLRVQDEILAKSGDYIRENANFIFYGWGRTENEWVAIESWKNEDTLNGLRNSPEFAEGVSRLMACCVRPIDIEIFSGIDSSRATFDLYPKGVSEFHPNRNGLCAIFR